MEINFLTTFDGQEQRNIEYRFFGFPSVPTAGLNAWTPASPVTPNFYEYNPLSSGTQQTPLTMAFNFTLINPTIARGYWSLLNVSGCGGTVEIAVTLFRAGRAY